MTSLPDLVCFSHLRWDFVYQRPQHLLSRCAKNRRVFFVEEPVFRNSSMRLEVRETESGVYVVVPHLPEGLSSEVAITAVLKEMTYRLFLENAINDYVFWYYTPMALRFTTHFNPIASVYDCMDELSAFRGADSSLPALEKELFRRVDLVFTGGQSLYEAKRNQHRAVYAFPSSIDAAHFGKARTATVDPADQADIPHPRLGFFGVIDERFDRELLDQIASQRPDWHFVMIGPVVKIDPDTLPKHANIHYLGGKKYDELPAYLAGWDIALLLFARNESTRFISPTKTPEYLAAGKPVISTSIQDVVRPYGELKLVEIADTADDFIRAAEKILSRSADDEWLARVDAFVANLSWDKTWSQMSALIDKVVERKRPVKSTKLPLGAIGKQTGAAAIP
ncbi:MAG TPA: glycosyltransferase family 1 protein [Pyrinomonadaceae bacterium]|nr:glycosyltransferase family 1 protein [Pyrinomonadaceae bacterium]